MAFIRIPFELFISRDNIATKIAYYCINLNNSIIHNILHDENNVFKSLLTMCSINLLNTIFVHIMYIV